MKPVIAPIETNKWCSHCRKHDHNDDECWCTRAVTAVVEKPSITSSSMRRIVPVELPTNYVTPPALKQALADLQRGRQ